VLRQLQARGGAAGHASRTTLAKEAVEEATNAAATEVLSCGHAAGRVGMQHARPLRLLLLRTKEAAATGVLRKKEAAATGVLRCRRAAGQMGHAACTTCCTC
jgi:hypothetical protein